MSTEAVSRPRGGGLLRRLGALIRPMYDAVVREPVEEGRLRFDGVVGVERQLAIVGMVSLIGLLVSLLFTEVWRSGTLAQLSDTGGRWLFVPDALLPVTLIGLFVGWLAFLWGAVRASLPVRLVAALLFLLLNADLGNPLTTEITPALALRYGHIVGRVGYFVAAGVVVAYSFVARDERVARRLRPVLLGILAASLAALFGSHLWVHVAQASTGTLDTSPLFINGAMEGIAFALTPMVMLATVALVDFSYAFGEGLSIPVRVWPATAAKAAVAGLIGIKLWIQLGRHLGEWASFLVHDRVSAIATTLTFVGIVLVGVLARRLKRSAESEEQAERVKERLILTGIAVAVAPLGISIVTSGAAFFVFQFQSHAANHFATQVNNVASDLTDWIRFVTWGLVLAAGVVLLARPGRSERNRELGLGYLLLGLINFPFYMAIQLGRPVGFDSAFLDLLVTGAVALVLIVRWRDLIGYQAAGLFAIVVFSWLLMTRGDFVPIIGGFVGLTANVILVFGVVWTLLSDSAMASGDGRWFPRAPRLLLWVGFLVLSVAILNWITATHGDDLSVATAARAFTDVGIPIAAWLVIRRPWTPREAELAALPTEEAELEVPPAER